MSKKEVHKHSYQSRYAKEMERKKKKETERWSNWQSEGMFSSLLLNQEDHETN